MEKVARGKAGEGWQALWQRQVRQQGISGRLRCRHAGQVRDGAAAGWGMMRVSSRKKEKGNRERDEKMCSVLAYGNAANDPTTSCLGDAAAAAAFSAS